MREIADHEEAAPSRLELVAIYVLWAALLLAGLLMPATVVCVVLGAEAFAGAFAVGALLAAGLAAAVALVIGLVF